MTLTLRIDTAAWRQHLAGVAAETPGLVPVAKGNGYGFGLPRLVAEAQLLCVDTLAVGLVAEVDVVRAAGWTGDVVVLTPWTPNDGALPTDDQVIWTVSRVDDLRALLAVRPTARVIVELLTSLRRHGLPIAELPHAIALLDAAGATLEGYTIHLPLQAPQLKPGARLAEARQLSAAALAVRAAPLWLSHLDADEYRELSASVGVTTRLRVGTKLWLGAPSTRRITASVLDVHPVRRGDHTGYWQRRVPLDGSVVVLSGGVANGIALRAPTAGSTARQRLIAAATGTMESLGFALSPYEIAGRKRFFVEPPHMQASMVFVPRGADANVHVGDEVPVRVRLVTATFDRIVG